MKIIATIAAAMLATSAHGATFTFQSTDPSPSYFFQGQFEATDANMDGQILTDEVTSWSSVVTRAPGSSSSTVFNLDLTSIAYTTGSGILDNVHLERSVTVACAAFPLGPKTETVEQYASAHVTNGNLTFRSRNENLPLTGECFGQSTGTLSPLAVTIAVSGDPYTGATTVPLPATAWILLGGLGALTVSRRQR